MLAAPKKRAMSERADPQDEIVVLTLRAEGLNPDEVVSETFPNTRLRATIDETEKRKWELIEAMKEIRALPSRFAPQHHEG